MKTIIFSVAGVTLAITAVLIQPLRVNSQTSVTAYQLRRTAIHATGSGPATSDQGRYQQRGSAGATVASAALDTERLTGSIGFWWPMKSEETGDEPARLFLPIIIKSGGAS